VSNVVDDDLIGQHFIEQDVRIPADGYAANSFEVGRLAEFGKTRQERPGRES